MMSQATVQQKSAVLFPVFSQIHVVPESISQLELGLLLSLRDRLAKIHRDVDSAEAGIRSRLEAGATVEPGLHSAALKESSRRSVGWKDVAIRLADRLKLDGEAYCARVLAATKPTKTISLEVR